MRKAFSVEMCVSECECCECVVEIYSGFRRCVDDATVTHRSVRDNISCHITRSPISEPRGTPLIDDPPLCGIFHVVEVGHIRGIKQVKEQKKNSFLTVKHFFNSNSLKQEKTNRNRDNVSDVVGYFLNFYNYY